MKFALRLMLVISLAFATFAFATNNNGGQDHTCQGGHNCNGGGSGDPGSGGTPSGSPASTTNTTTNTNTDVNANTNSNHNTSSSNSAAISGSRSNSNASSSANQGQQQGQIQGQGQGQRQTATGGSSYSGVEGSGNSTSSNKNTATGGYSGVDNSGNSASSASNNGSDVAVLNETNVAAPKIPVATAYAPTAIPTVPCALGYSGGGQGMLAGAAGAFTRVDKTCQQLEVARSFAISGARKAYCAVMITTKWAKKAHVSLEDCMYLDPVPPSTKAEVTPEPKSNVVIYTPAPLISTPVVLGDKLVAPAHTLTSIGECDKLDNRCKQLIDDAVLSLKNDGATAVTLTGNVHDLSFAVAVRRAFVANGIDSSRVAILLTDEHRQGTIALGL